MAERLGESSAGATLISRGGTVRDEYIDEAFPSTKLRFLELNKLIPSVEDAPDFIFEGEALE